MSTFISPAGNHVVLLEGKKAEAEAWLREECEIKEDDQIACDEQGCVICESGNGKSWFTGEVSHSFSEDVEEFLKKFCETGSWMDFHEDDFACFEHIEKTSDGEVEIKEDEEVNPFELTGKGGTLERLHDSFGELTGWKGLDAEDAVEEFCRYLKKHLSRW
jgi:hypothetical protein